MSTEENRMETATELLEEGMEQGSTKETCRDEIKSYEMTELVFLKQFVILGVSQHSDPNLIVKAIDVLNKMLQRGEEELDHFIEILREISEGGHNISQNAIFLCLVKCYLHEKSSVSDVIPVFCRIPTHLFVFLKMLKDYIEKGTDTAEYYEALTRGIGSNVELANAKKNKKANPSNDKVDSGTKVSSFVPKHKFISKWYTDPKKTAQDLLLLLTKYPRRHEWDNKSLCRYAHVKINENDPEKTEKNIVILYHLHGFKKIEEEYKKHVASKFQGSEVSSRIFKYIEILEEAKKGDTTGTAQLIRNSKRRISAVAQTPQGQLAFTFNTSSLSVEEEELNDSFGDTGQKLTRLHLAIEHLPPKMYKEKEIWDALIQDMPMAAMLKHVSHMASLGLFEHEKNVKIVQQAFTDEHRMFPFTHPFQVLKALIAYQHGSSWYNNKKTWIVSSEICNILKDAFCLCLKRKRDVHFDNCLVCIDVSQPMGKNGFLGFDMLTAAMASVAVATAIEEMGRNNNIFICGSDIKVMEKKTLMGRLEEIKTCSSGRTNISQPIREAWEKKKSVDAIIIFTMCRKEKIRGPSPYETYNQYKEIMKPTDTKLVICSMEANNCLFANPQDPNVITVCGGDADILTEIYRGVYPNNNNDSMEM